jgi:hypothetical protein
MHTHLKDLKAKWNEYANLTTAKNEGWREGKREGIEDSKSEIVKKTAIGN